MNNQKNRIWTFCCSLMPGAGEMYFGLYRQGISIMTFFFLLLIVPIMLNLSAISLLAIVLWFYSFLHVNNLRSLTEEQFSQEKDYYIWEIIPDSIMTSAKTKNVVAILLIILGAYMLLYSVVAWIPGLRNLSYYLIRLVLGALILALGIRLITGKKQDLDQNFAAAASEPSAETIYTDIPAFPLQEEPEKEAAEEETEADTDLPEENQLNENP